jgi:hypothetical protein
MNDADRRKLKDAFNAWAANAPEPDSPAIGFAGERMRTPREAAREVENETEFGKAWLEILEHGVKREGIDKVVERLTRRHAKP